MKTALSAFAVLLLAGAAHVQPASAQTMPQRSNGVAPNQAAPQQPGVGSSGATSGMQTPLPQGSYRSACHDARIDGQTLIAFCPKGDGTWQTTAIGPVSQCAGDIQNVNGELRCNETGFGSSTPPAQAQPAPAQPKYH
jgi:hypothetical protein